MLRDDEGLRLEQWRAGPLAHSSSRSSAGWGPEHRDACCCSCCWGGRTTHGLGGQREEGEGINHPARPREGRCLWRTAASPTTARSRSEHRWGAEWPALHGHPCRMVAAASSLPGATASGQRRRRSGRRERRARRARCPPGGAQQRNGFHGCALCRSGPGTRLSRLPAAPAFQLLCLLFLRRGQRWLLLRRLGWQWLLLAGRRAGRCSSSSRGSTARVGLHRPCTCD